MIKWKQASENESSPAPNSRFPETLNASGPTGREWRLSTKGNKQKQFLRRTLECRLDISKADLKISYPVSYYDLQLRAKCRKN